MQKKLVIAAVAALILLGGVIFVSQKKMAEIQPLPTPEQNKEDVQSINTSDWRVQQSEVKTFEPVINEKGYVWFPVPELGIEIKIKGSIVEELVYQTRESEGGTFAQFTTKRLMKIGEELYGSSFAKDGGYECSLGSFAAYQNMSEKNHDEKYEYVRNHGASIGNIFVAYYSMQSPCVLTSESINSDSSDKEYEQSVIGSWWGRPTSSYTETWGPMENIRESVRSIR